MKITNRHYQWILYSQVTWLVLAVIYNLISIWRIRNGMDTLIGEHPEYTLASLSIFVLVIYLGFINFTRSYLTMLCLVIPGLMYIGVWRHIDSYLMDNSLEKYASFSAWFWAIGINVFGCSAFILAVINSKRWTRKTHRADYD